MSVPLSRLLFPEKEILKYKAELPSCKNRILYIDTEQSKCHCHKATSLVTQNVDKIMQELEQKNKVQQDNGQRNEVKQSVPEGKVFYSSVAYLQSADDTSRLDALREKGDYEGLLRLAKEYYDGNGINEQ